MCIAKNNAVLLVAIGSFFLILQHSEAKPSKTLIRHKRVSDQRLAELETLLALSKMRGKVVSVPIGFGKVDPSKLGRKRRSSDGDELQELRRLIKNEVDLGVELSPEERSQFIARLLSTKMYEEDLGKDDNNEPRENFNAIY